MKLEIIKVFIGEVASKGILLVASLMLINLMSIEGYSKFTIIMTLLMLGSQLVCAAVERLYIASHEEFSKHAWCLVLLCIIIFSSIIVFYLWRKASPAEIVLTCLGVFLLSVHQFGRIKFQQKQNFLLYIISDLMKNAGWLIFLGLAVLFKSEITPILAVSLLLVSAAISLIILFPAQKGLLRSQSIPSIILVLKQYGSVYIYTGVAAMMPYLPIIIANNHEQEELVATYGAAMRYQAIVAMLVQVFNSVYLPKLAARGRSLAYSYLRETLGLIALIFFVGLLGVAIIFFAIPYIDGGKYPDSQGIFLVFSMCTLSSMVSVTSINYLLINSQYRVILLIMLFGFCSTIVCSEFLSPYFPIYGIALSSLFGFLIINSLVSYQAWKKRL